MPEVVSVSRRVRNLKVCGHENMVPYPNCNNKVLNSIESSNVLTVCVHYSRHFSIKYQYCEANPAYKIAVDVSYWYLAFTTAAASGEVSNRPF